MKRLLPLLAFVTIALIGVVSAIFVWTADQRNREIRFAVLAEEAAGRVSERIERHMLLIEATAALFEAQDDWITREQFQVYFRNLDLTGRNPGSVGLGYSVFARSDERAALALAYEANNHIPLSIWPETGGESVVVAVLFETDAPGPTRTSGFDAYSDPTRRAAIDRAIADRAPRATGPVSLVSDGADDEIGFLIYAPVYGSTFGIAARPTSDQRPTGFVAAAFRVGELVTAAIDVAPRLPVNVSIADAAAPGIPLFVTGDAPAAGVGERYTVVRRTDVAGREWIGTIRPTAAFQPVSVGPLAVALGVVSLLLAGAAAMMLREQARAHDAADALAASTQRNLAEKDLMLQEMKHRIKNAIARILAIARQTAAHSDSQESFNQTFSERLRAMSNAQDVLTRSSWQRADLRELLGQELEQVFGPDFDPGRMRGPKVELDERTTQALGLTFHELATNTLKYGAGAATIEISWTLVAQGRERGLRIDWVESGGEGVAAPEATGFGTKLIDANVRHELGGAVERDYRPEGLCLRLCIPLDTRKAA